MRRTRPALTALLVPLAALLGCAGDAPVVREWALEEDLRIGAPGDPGGPLTRVGSVLAKPDGGVWILQPTDREIRSYGEDGALLGRVGHAGEGPGGLTLPNRMGWWGSGMDTVWVADLGVRRLSLFTAAGEFAAGYPLPFVQHESVYSVNQPGAVRANGTALAVAAYSPIVTEWEDFPVLRYTLAEGRVEEELLRLERTGTVMIRWQERGITTALHPLPDAPLVAFAPDGERVLVVDRSTEEASLGRVGLLMLSAEGDTLWSREIPYDPQPIPQPEIDSLVAPRIASIRDFATVEGSLTPDQAEQAYRESVVLPAFRPPVQAVHVALDGRIWLAWASAPGQPERWWVLDAEGRQVAEFSTPRALDLRGAGEDFAWVLETEGGAAQLVRYRVSELQR